MSENKISVQDRLEISDLLIRYSVARDDCQLDALMDCFTEDAVFVRSGREVQGLSAIREFFEASMSRYDITNHTVHGVMLDPTNTPLEHTGLVPGHAELVLNGKLNVAAYRYRDTYRKVDGRWLLARRQLGFMFAMPVEELSQGFSDDLTVRWPGAAPAPRDHPQFQRSNAL